MKPICKAKGFLGGVSLVRGIYTATSGMLVQALNSDVISNNLANVDTAGYQRQTNQVMAFPDMLVARQHKNDNAIIGRMGTGAIVADSAISFAPGRIQRTGNALDVALIGPGFFAIDTPDGTRYTRDGRFTLNSSGWLVTLDGNRVRGQNGPILVGEGEISIDSEGVIRENGEIVDRLLVVEFNDRDGLQKQGANLYQATEQAGLPIRYPGVVAQGSLEMANLNVIREMVNLIEVQRSYEANSKVVQAYDGILDKAVNELGRL